MNDAASPLLTVRNLHVHFPFARGPFWNRRRGVVRAVDGVSFDVPASRTLGLVGESGCGKSTTARAVLQLLKPTSGEITLHTERGPVRLDQLGERGMWKYRQTLQMIFQDPFSSLNPRMTVGQILSEPMEIFGKLRGRERKLEAMRLLDLVGLNPRYLNRYPHEFSGGQRQRIGIARALAVEPTILFCDEPVSALDVSIQAQILNLLQDLQQQLGLALVFIAHDLAVVRHLSSTVAVMYLGRIVETAPAVELYRRPRHPYTEALLSAVPIPSPEIERQRERIILHGEIPTPDRAYPGCPFADRCPRVQARCREEVPHLEGDEHQVSCFYPT